MIDVNMRYLLRHRDRHGNLRHYVRLVGRPMVRLRAEPGTPAFFAEYSAALERIRSGEVVPAATRPEAAAPGSLRQLCQQYYGSAEWQRLAPSTRKVRRRLYDRIAARAGAKPWQRIEAAHIRKRRDELADRPEAANGFVKALRQLFAWAIETGLATANPARDVPYLRSGSEGFHAWTPDEIARFEARHAIGTKARLALALLLFTGVRRGDVVALGRQMVRPPVAGAAQGGAWLHFTEGKGRLRYAKARAIPILPELQAVIDATPSGHMTFLVTEHGKPYSAGGFGNWFQRRCQEAGLEHCSAHGLRKAGATLAADNGATEHQLMAIFGWHSPKQAALYTRNANRRKLVGDAMHLLAAGRTRNGSESPSAAVQAGDSNRAPKPLKKKA